MNGVDIEIRPATEEDVPTMVAMLADDPLGALRERSGREVSGPYRAAFRALAADPNHTLLVAEVAGAVVGMLQLSFIPHLTYEGGWRAQIEGVRVAASERSRGIGRLMMDAAIQRAGDHGCHLLQLTTDRRRPEALDFYLGLGFEASHHGLKLHLDRENP